MSGVPLALRAAALRMVREGATPAFAGAQVGVSRQRVHQWARVEGVDTSKGRLRKAMKPALVGAKTVQVRGVTLAKVSAVERSPELA